jgi:hypothetical protein
VDHRAQEKEMTDEQIKALLAGCEFATRGPWLEMAGKLYGDEDGGAYTTIALTPHPKSLASSPRGEQWRKDATHIARCDPTTIAELCTRLLSAEKLLQWYVDHYGPEAPGLPERFVERKTNAD